MKNFQCISTELYPDNGEPISIKIDTLDHKSGVAHLCKGFDISPEDWPDGYGISNEIVTLSTHQGTHIDAPMHYYPEGSDIVDADISQFMGHAVIFTDTTHGATEVRLNWEDYIARLDKYQGVAKAVFFITGAYKRYGDTSYFLDFKGVPVEYVEAALDRGYSVIGTDAFSLDPPFSVMSQAFVETKDKSKLWPAHVLGRTRPYYQIERLCHLKDFEQAQLAEFIALPIKIRCGASWTRAVARIVE
ncbi:cyclase family protein [Vibrio cholerae]|uniref:cyclase family protein n=1 Tax=Vibrio cholerae TaxID=666 RepID=UPI0028BABB71|nr:cyclase family protein [Vibrio cholerae]EJB0230105.1 cyclase family protein [Vibrio vulnificus]EKF9485874.1 cyclase family protein [Vibrio cholerae]ELP3384929.1 cyclase family protein [Vibrio cholerae]ELP3388181.1 cyclase family protein [Vibrio cholerae]ELR9907534.1 cyclase family protein [Vibrio cholerae]